MKLKLYIILNFIFLISFTQASEKFDYTLLDIILKTYVSGDKVNYKDLLNDKEKLIEFTTKLAKISPDSHPELFPNKNDKLAYWINAYNAYILQTIINEYPVESIKDINFIGATIWWNKNLLGGEKISFNELEHDIIRDRFKDPRIHFAINCASISCPPLINEAYLPQTLDEQLDKSTKAFINNENNFKVDIKNKTIYMSAIFDWYEEDYIDWLIKNQKKGDDPIILDYIKLYYQKQFKEAWYYYDIEVLEYDWSLNE